MISKVGGAPKALMERSRVHFKEFIDTLVDTVFKGWRELLGAPPVAEDETAEVIDESVYETEELTEESKTFSNESLGEEPDGETMELTPAETELLENESELNGDGRRTYSVIDIDWRNISKFESEDLGFYSKGINVSDLISRGYNKYYIFTNNEEYKSCSSELRSSGALIYTITQFDPELESDSKVVLVFSNDNSLGLFKRFTKNYSSLPKLDWGYTNDLIKQGYDETGLSKKDIRTLYNEGYNRFYAFEDMPEGEKYIKVLGDKIKSYKIHDTELGDVTIVFAPSKEVKKFSNSLKKFSK